MKRIALAASALLLISCVRTGDLQSADVLSRASEASQSLTSATFSVDASAKGMTSVFPESIDGTLEMEGKMQNAGKQLSFSANLDVQSGASRLKGSIDMIVAGERETYLKINELTMAPESMLFPSAILSQVANQWWLLPSATGSMINTSDITPDPSFLNMQTSIINVTKDRGLDTINGRSAYHYDVSVDPAKMKTYLEDVATKRGDSNESNPFEGMNAVGELWIDSRTFVVHRVIWNLTSTDSAKPLTVHIDAVFANHDKPVTISLPAGAKPLPVGATLPSIPY